MERMTRPCVELVLRVAMCLTVLLPLATVVQAQGKSRVGTWELDLSRSTFSPGPAPQKQTLTFEEKGPQWTALIQGVDASGRPINVDANNLMITFDGRDHPTASVDYETTAWKRVNENKYLVIRKKAGKVVLTSTNILSADGKTMTITTVGQNAAGQPVHNVRVYVRR